MKRNWEARAVWLAVVPWVKFLSLRFTPGLCPPRRRRARVVLQRVILSRHLWRVARHPLKSRVKFVPLFPPVALVVALPCLAQPRHAPPSPAAPSPAPRSLCRELVQDGSLAGLPLRRSTLRAPRPPLCRGKPRGHRLASGYEGRVLDLGQRTAFGADVFHSARKIGAME